MYKSIAAAEDWFYVIPASPNIPNSEMIVWRLAAWALTDDSHVIGLVSVSSQDWVGLGSGEAKPNRLAPVPPLSGMYKHWSELTEEERATAFKPKP